mmetsp:Transcript_37799/g.99978  ORF Transcript_37799/g.99978 Transcript_37799/m.99978 type:complete len:88 (-) Transcript_37799:113-376(-)
MTFPKPFDALPEGAVSLQSTALIPLIRFTLVASMAKFIFMLDEYHRRRKIWPLSFMQHCAGLPYWCAAELGQVQVQNYWLRCIEALL